MLFDAFTLYPETPPSKICIELSADILYEEMDEAIPRIAELREMGVKIAVCEVGDEFCPVFRLATLPVDYAFMDEYATASLDRDDAERIAGSLVKYLHYLDVKVIAPELDNEDKISGAKTVECDGYTVAEIPVEAEELPIEDEAEENKVEEEGSEA
jgi:EAL domain-containing protein (putative c-di-GMP-specific phosphodiesterase class I)